MPTPSIKGWRIKAAWVAPLFMVAMLLTAALINNTWLVLSCVGVLYAASLPVGWYRYTREKKYQESIAKG
jgi:hypothetical protein